MASASWGSGSGWTGTPVPPGARPVRSAAADVPVTPRYSPNPHLIDLLESSPSAVAQSQGRAAKADGCPEHGAVCPLLRVDRRGWREALREFTRSLFCTGLGRI